MGKARFSTVTSTGYQGHLVQMINVVLNNLEVQPITTAVVRHEPHFISKGAQQPPQSAVAPMRLMTFATLCA